MDEIIHAASCMADRWMRSSNSLRLRPQYSCSFSESSTHCLGARNCVGSVWRIKHLPSMSLLLCVAVCFDHLETATGLWFGCPRTLVLSLAHAGPTLDVVLSFPRQATGILGHPMGASRSVHTRALQHGSHTHNVGRCYMDILHRTRTRSLARTMHRCRTHHRQCHSQFPSPTCTGWPS